MIEDLLKLMLGDELGKLFGGKEAPAPATPRVSLATHNLAVQTHVPAGEKVVRQTALSTQRPPEQILLNPATERRKLLDTIARVRSIFGVMQVPIKDQIDKAQLQIQDVSSVDLVVQNNFKIMGQQIDIITKAIIKHDQRFDALEKTMNTRLVKVSEMITQKQDKFFKHIDSRLRRLETAASKLDDEMDYHVEKFNKLLADVSFLKGQQGRQGTQVTTAQPTILSNRPLPSSGGLLSSFGKLLGGVAGAALLWKVLPQEFKDKLEGMVVDTAEAAVKKAWNSIWDKDWAIAESNGIKTLKRYMNDFLASETNKKLGDITKRAMKEVDDYITSRMRTKMKEAYDYEQTWKKEHPGSSWVGEELKKIPFREIPGDIYNFMTDPSVAEHHRKIANEPFWGHKTSPAFRNLQRRQARAQQSGTQHHVISGGSGLGMGGLDDRTGSKAVQEWARRQHRAVWRGRTGRELGESEDTDIAMFKAMNTPGAIRNVFGGTSAAAAPRGPSSQYLPLWQAEEAGRNRAMMPAQSAAYVQMQMARMAHGSWGSGIPGMGQWPGYYGGRGPTGPGYTPFTGGRGPGRGGGGYVPYDGGGGTPAAPPGIAHAQGVLSRYSSQAIIGGPDFRGQGGPNTVKYNNPTGMNEAPWEKKYGGVGSHLIGGGNKIEEFPNVVSGMGAAFDLYSQKYTGRTVGDAIGEWSGHNSVPSYLAVLNKETGGNIKANTVITPEMWKNRQFAISMVKAMSVQEAGTRQYANLPQAVWEAGYDRYLHGGKDVTSPWAKASPGMARFQAVMSHRGTGAPASAYPTSPKVSAASGLGVPIGSPDEVSELNKNRPRIMQGTFGIGDYTTPFGSGGFPSDKFGGQPAYGIPYGTYGFKSEYDVDHFKRRGTTEIGRVTQLGNLKDDEIPDPMSPNKFRGAIELHGWPSVENLRSQGCIAISPDAVPEVKKRYDAMVKRYGEDQLALVVSKTKAGDQIRIVPRSSLTSAPISVSQAVSDAKQQASASPSRGEKMLILPGASKYGKNHSDPNGLLDRDAAIAYARAKGYEPKIIDVPGNNREAQIKAANAAMAADPSITAGYGFSDGGENLAKVAQANPGRFKQVDVLGASPATSAFGNAETRIHPDPPSGHMDGPKVLLAKTQAQSSQIATAGNLAPASGLGMPPSPAARDFGSMAPVAPRKIETHEGMPDEYNYALKIGPEKGQWGKDKNLTTVTYSNGQKIQVNATVADRFKSWGEDMIKRGYPLSTEGGGGYNWRDKKGGGKGPSDHSTGYAGDFNVGTNKQFGTSDFPENAEKLGWLHGLAWGAHFQNAQGKSISDPMHWEAMGPQAWASHLMQLHKEGLVSDADLRQIAQSNNLTMPELQAIASTSPSQAAPSALGVAAPSIPKGPALWTGAKIGSAAFWGQQQPTGMSPALAAMHQGTGAFSGLGADSTGKKIAPVNRFSFGAGLPQHTRNRMLPFMKSAKAAAQPPPHAIRAQHMTAQGGMITTDRHAQTVGPHGGIVGGERAGVHPATKSVANLKRRQSRSAAAANAKQASSEAPTGRKGDDGQGTGGAKLSSPRNQSGADNSNPGAGDMGSGDSHPCLI